MTELRPGTAPRERESGYKGDAWRVALPTRAADDGEMMLILDTGLDSVAIVPHPRRGWDRRRAVDRLCPRPATTKRSSSHAGPARSTTVRIRVRSQVLAVRGPVTIVLPAGMLASRRDGRGRPCRTRLPSSRWPGPSSSRSPSRWTSSPGAGSRSGTSPSCIRRRSRRGSGQPRLRAPRGPGRSRTPRWRPTERASATDRGRSRASFRIRLHVTA